MAINSLYNWPVSNPQAVSVSQDVTDNNFFVLNGDLVDPFLPNQISFIKYGFTRNVRITSENDDTGITFVITGMQNGIAITEDVVGGNATSVYSTNSYDVINSIKVTNGDVLNVQIGTGNIGYLPVIVLNNVVHVLQAVSLSIRLSNNGGSLQYNVYASTEFFTKYLYTYDQMINNGIIFQTMITDEQNSNVLSDVLISNLFLVQITASQNPDIDSAVVAFLQL